MEASLFIDLNVGYFERRLSRAVVVLHTEDIRNVVDFVLFFFKKFKLNEIVPVYLL